MTIGSKTKKTVSAYVLLLPALSIALIFVYAPAVYVLGLSFFEWDLISPVKEFVGFENYINLFSPGSGFWNSVFRTLEYSLLYIPVSMIVGLGAALLLHNIKKGRDFFQVLYFVPSVTSIAVIAIIWSYLYNPQVGFLNSFLLRLGLPADKLPQYLNDSVLAIPSIALMGIWQSSGFVLLLFFTGLESIPKSYYEAADIDGASGFFRFRKITLPFLSPVMFFVVFMLLINSFQVFGPVAIMTKGRPLDSTNVLLYYIYQNAFQFFKSGPASAASCVVFVIVFLFVMVQFKLGERSVFYK